MNTKLLVPVSALILSGSIFAGEESVEAAGPVAVTTEPDAFTWLTPTIDFRTRYEFRDTDPFDASHALTARARLGLVVGEFNGFSAFGEVEANYALIDDYNGGGGGSSTPNDLANTTIGDPENVELNRAWARYAGNGFDAKLGRQRIIRNNAAMIGNVGWRQNEQTFDAASLAFGGDGYNLFYAYSNRAQRIFGQDAAEFKEEMTGDFHFIDGSMDLDGGSLGGYIYLIDVDDVGVQASRNVGRSNTFGAYYKCRGLHAELAWQDGSSDLAGGGYDAPYGHLKYSKKIIGATYGGGLEYLGEYFKTPFATVHAFNGFADAFIGQRIGLNNAMGYHGLADLYLSYVRPALPWDLTFKGFGHYFLDDGFSNSYGWELDGVLAKKFNDNLSALMKLAFFFENDGSDGYEDIQQVSLQFDYKF